MQNIATLFKLSHVLLPRTTHKNNWGKDIREPEMFEPMTAFLKNQGYTILQTNKGRLRRELFEDMRVYF